MSTLVTIQGTDLPTNSRANINDNFAALNADKLETSVLDTDTTLAADSDAKVPTQKAVKAYVDAGGNVNASTIAKGIVEIATQDEVNAGTATGSTGASLVVTPDTIAGAVGKKAVTAGATINGATLPVPVYQNKTDNEFYACDANDTAAMKYLGFAITNGVDGGSITVQFSGIVAGFTGLSEGEKYYVQDTVGTIGTSIGTYEILVGIAISETELLIQKGPRRTAGVFNTGTSNSSQVVTCGFRLSKLQMISLLGGGVTITNYVNGVKSGYSIAADNSFLSGGDVLESNGGDRWEYTIGSITDTGFTISWAESASMGDTVVAWTAEGEL